MILVVIADQCYIRSIHLADDPALLTDTQARHLHRKELEKQGVIRSGTTETVTYLDLRVPQKRAPKGGE